MLQETHLMPRERSPADPVNGSSTRFEIALSNARIVGVRFRMLDFLPLDLALAKIQLRLCALEKSSSPPLRPQRRAHCQPQSGDQGGRRR